MLNNVVGYWAYIRGLIFGRLIFGGRAYIWNEVSVSTCMWVAYTRGGGGLLYIRRFTVREVGIVTNINVIRSYFLVFFTSSSFVVVCPVLFCLWVSAFTLCVYSASTFFYTNGPGELVHVTEKGGLIPQQSIGIKVHVYCWPVDLSLQLYNSTI